MASDAVESARARWRADLPAIRGDTQDNSGDQGVPVVAAAHRARGVIPEDLIDAINELIDARLDAWYAEGPIPADWIICQCGSSCHVPAAS